jgi:hypothetical protein
VNLDPTQEEMMQWIDDMEAIANRTDLTQEQKEALVTEKIRKYDQDLKALLDAEEKRREELRKSMSPDERDLDKSRWSFYRKWREGKVFIRRIE